MSGHVVKLPSGRWRARLKNGDRYISGRTFDRKRDARVWMERQRKLLEDGYDLRNGRQQLDDLIVQWLEYRAGMVTSKTHAVDRGLAGKLPVEMRSSQIGQVTPRDVERAYVQLLDAGMARSTVVRMKSSLAAFCSWAVEEGAIIKNPVHGTKVPPRMGGEGMRPFTESELEAVYLKGKALHAGYADLILFLGWTGLRWSEARVLKPDDVSEDLGAVYVRRAQPEGAPMQSTKTRQERRVPVAGMIWKIVRARVEADGRWLFSGRDGGQLYSSNVRREMWNEIAGGRTLRELRHTAACIWLRRQIDVATVSGWLGHASLTTTHVYVKYLGSRADATAVAQLNAPVQGWYTEGGEYGAAGEPSVVESRG